MKYIGNLINKRSASVFLLNVFLSLVVYSYIGSTGEVRTVFARESEAEIVTVEELDASIDMIKLKSIPESTVPCTLTFENHVGEELLSVSANNTFVEEIVEEDISDEEKWTSVTESSEPYTMFVDVGLDSGLNVRSEAVTGRDNIIGGLRFGDQVTVIGYNTYDRNWSAIEYKGYTAFVCNDYLSEWVDLSLRKETTYENPKWDGVTKLNATNGRIQGPSGEETYYNLDMTHIVKRMHKKGYDYEYWVREDGVKMFGDYIMVAANLKTRPRGSLVETSLGTGIVVDTGGFVKWSPNGIDIAVTW